MGRGLSDLQRRILAAAYQQRDDDEPIRYRAEAFWLAPEWLHVLAINIYDAQKRHWRIGFLADNPEGRGRHKFDAVLDLEEMTSKMIGKAVQEAKEAGEPSGVYLGEPSSYAKLLSNLMRWNIRKLGFHAESEFKFGGYRIVRGNLGWAIHSVAEFTEAAEAEAMKAKLETVLGGFEQFDGAWVDSNQLKTIAYNELLAELFDFPVSGHLDARAFDVRAIGAERYNAARASLQRACLRLEQRGLIERYAQADLYERAGIYLTTAGASAAAAV